MKRLNVFLIGLLVFLGSFGVLAKEENKASDDSLRQISQQLVTAKLKATPAIVEQLEVGGERAVSLFEALIEGDLYYRKEDKLIVIANKQDAGDYRLIDSLTAEFIANSDKKSIKKIRVNNSIRTQLRDMIARVTLASSD
ncbi:MAG: hypothetical protein QMC38_11585, partial [Sinobacterium sp.]